MPEPLYDGTMGIIPAYAGNTECAALTIEEVRDHPRVCGEHTGAGAANVTVKGSSPRMRGTLLAAFLAVSRTGIIPAYAGNTVCAVRRVIGREDHPRVCGEHEILSRCCQKPLGSSPRMRGTPHPVRRGGGALGIIPAYAGNTSYWIFDAAATRDHPRVCGEHPSGHGSTAAMWGSSPRMRGTHPVASVEFQRLGIIPAYAGNTRRR